MVPTRAQQLGLIITLALLTALVCSGCSVCDYRSWRFSGRPPPERARSVSSWRSATAARSSAVTDRRLPWVRHRDRQASARGASWHPHHLIDIVHPNGSTAARYARDAKRHIRGITRGTLADTRRWDGPLLPGLGARPVPGAAGVPTAEARLESISARRGASDRCIGWSSGSTRHPPREFIPKISSVSSALEIFFPYGASVDETICRHRVTARRIRDRADRIDRSPAVIADRVARRVTISSNAACWTRFGVFWRVACATPPSVRRSGVSPGARAPARRAQVETRALIAQENRRYARRRLIWFRKEPNLCGLV